MFKHFLLLSFTCGLLFAETEQTGSKLLIDSGSKEVDHESAYGITSNYSFLVAGHQIQGDDSLQFYYGTKVGVITEAHTAENGFGPEVGNFGTMLEVDMGLHYALKDLEHLTLEGSRLKKALHQPQENQLKIGYQYKF